eukprot:1161112-Pelagomonas_calceolata.AAC.1
MMHDSALKAAMLQVFHYHEWTCMRKDPKPSNKVRPSLKKSWLCNNKHNIVAGRLRRKSKGCGASPPVPQYRNRKVP